MCGYLGGRDYKEAVRRILQKVFCHELAIALIWNRGMQKTSIQNFPNVLLFITGKYNYNQSNCLTIVMQGF